MDYKNSYFAEFTKEVTTIELDSVEFDRWGEVEYDEDDKPIQIMRASRYTSKKNELAKNYDVYINQIAQHTLNELTLQRDDVLKRIVNRLAQMDGHIDDAWKVYFEQNKLWWDGKFSSLDFEWKFFHFFNIPVTRSAGMMENPDFEKGKTTDNFFWDIHDAMMYKQGAVKWVLWHLREHLDIKEQLKDGLGDQQQNPDNVHSVTSKDEEDPRQSEFPSPDKQMETWSNPQLSLLCTYLSNHLDEFNPTTDEEIKRLLEKYTNNKSIKAFRDDLNYYGIRINRTGVWNSSSKTHNKNCICFDKVIRELKIRNQKDALMLASREYDEYLTAYEKVVNNQQ